MSKNKEENNAIADDDLFADKRDAREGICSYCHRFNTQTSWCQSCDPQRVNNPRLKSENEKLNNFINKIQYKITEYHRAIEWIPFDRLKNIEKIGEGYFNEIYSATWIDGYRQLQWDKYKTLRGSRKSNGLVALRCIKRNENKIDIIQEFKIHCRCQVNNNHLRVYGITLNPYTMDYMIVIKYAEFGNLRNYLSLNFYQLVWSEKLGFLRRIIEDLATIHAAGYMHLNLHSGNILQTNDGKGRIISAISDFRFAKKIDGRNNLKKERKEEKKEEREEINGEEKKEEKEKKQISGVIPYIAPEVIINQQFSSTVDIYSFGVIMAEMSTGFPPFYDCAHDLELARKICNGLRPEFGEGTPEYYIQFARKCMRHNPLDRPNSTTCKNMISRMWNISNGVEEFLLPEQLKIRYEFDKADDKIQRRLNNNNNNHHHCNNNNNNLSYHPHPQAIYSCRLLEFRK
ncbi:hypothetical protein Glove_396g58 [Diversispora epigaea]|uniref:non-specific serine/threonine protein kinase n=1 Tax=Diversispora epigaea TaxID=1348612 RepID=A0A397H567_9GLOM|nr:hypothetical protein Glove_396g58 [Diversispora epigaea]